MVLVTWLLFSLLASSPHSSLASGSGTSILLSSGVQASSWGSASLPSPEPSASEEPSPAPVEMTEPTTEPDALLAEVQALHATVLLGLGILTFTTAAMLFLSGRPR